MSYKSALSSSIKSNCEPQQWIKGPVETNVKFAGEEAKDRLYEPKHKKKLVRVLTVVAYIFSVSLAAIMLSLYYVFLYHSKVHVRDFTETTTATGLTRAPNGILIQSLRKEPINLPFDLPTTEQPESYILPSKSKRTAFMHKLMSTFDTNYLNHTFDLN